ncbi:hypothetical protein BEN74_18620 [Acinetobacter sp. WCHAc010034]|nr:hypothetical protein BEN74_18620 [Acinetobacter sp. WCHAc010034]
MDIELERKAFEAWHESKYGEHVTWANGAPVSHIHDDRWQGWRAAKARPGLPATVLQSLKEVS